MSREKSSEVAQLVSEKKFLEELLSVRDRTVQEQSLKLSEALSELQSRASALEISQEELARQTQILQLILNSLTVGVVVADSKGRFLLFNPAAEAMLGVGLTETDPDQWAEEYGCFDPDTKTRFQTRDLPLVRSLRGERVHDVQILIENKNRPQGVLISVSANPLIDSSGKIQGSVAVFYDITERKRIEEALRRSERESASLFLGAADPIVILDKNGFIMDLNPAVSKTSGYLLADLSGKHFVNSKVIASSSLPKAIQEFTRITLGYETSPFELEIISKSGKVLHFEAHARRIDRGPEIDSVQVIFRDRTEQRKSERRRAVRHAVTRVLSESEEMSDVVFRVMEAVGSTLGFDYAAVWKKEPESDCLLCFQTWQKSNLYSDFELTLKQTLLAADEGLPGKVWQNQRAIWIADLSTEDVLNHDRSFGAGFGFPFCIAGSPAGVMTFWAKYPDDEDPEMLEMLNAVGTQISQFMGRKKIEQTLMLKQVELAKAQAEREQLEIFAYVASHDLQEPLQKILAYADFLKEQLSSGAGPKVKEYLQKIEAAALRMSGLTNDLLKYMKASSKSGAPDWVALSALLGQVLKEMDDEIRACGGRVDYGSLPILKADVRQMHQLFQNLISNSLKFRRKETPIQISISSRDSDPGYAEIVFQDNGIGFDQNYAEQIFKPFERLCTDKVYAGNGIGLAICRKIVERHRGTIKVQSREGYGTLFVIKIPLA